MTLNGKKGNQMPLKNVFPETEWIKKHKDGLGF